MAHPFTELLYHVIFSTKDREPNIDNELKLQLYPYMGGIIRELKGKALMVNGLADHVHLLLSLSSVAPPGLYRRWCDLTHGLRRGLLPYAAPRLTANHRLKAVASNSVRP